MNFTENEDSLQFFKEERVEGAVYALYLKKVRYHSPAEVCTTADDNFSHLQWRTIEIKVLKSGTLERIVESLSSEDGELDSTYVSVFLSTYRAFATTKEALTLMLERYRMIGDDQDMKQEVKEAHRKTLRTVISVWLAENPEDFHDPPSYTCLRSLQHFAEKHMEGGDLAHRAKHRLDKFRREDDTHRGVSVEDIDFHFSLLDEVNAMADPLPSMLERPLEFETIECQIFAEQLTYMDAELFKKVVPHHCLGCVWSRRDKKRINAPSVYATVNQFNAVSYRVIATVLKHPLDFTVVDRARIIERWIEVAQELRYLKNFSSLKAIISGLQSNAVYRLHKVWDQVDKEYMTLFLELSQIFSEDNNQMMARELLMKEGTAKFADLENTTGVNTINKHRRKISMGTSSSRRKSMIDFPHSVQGTVPYLGTFLTDLTMIDTAIPDMTEDSLINFEKRRKEFEILAQIKLLQSAANMYHFRPEQAFFEWFHNIRVYDEKESYELSCEIEPATPSTPKEVKGHRKKSSLGFFAPRRPASTDELSLPSPDYSDTSSETSYSSISTPSDASFSHHKTPLRHSISVGSLRSMEEITGASLLQSPETRVVKVSMEVSESHYTNYYKSILLSNNDHTKTVLMNIMSKFNIEGKPEDFVMFQILPDSELMIPDKGNVFYAINNNTPEVRFLVRKRSDLEKLQKQKKKNNKKYTL